MISIKAALRIADCGLRIADCRTYQSAIQNPKSKIFLALCILLSGSCAAPLFAETADRIVAVVNGEVITQADVTARLHALLEEQDAPDPAETDTAQMEQAMLQRLIEQRLILQEANRAGIKVTFDEVAQRLDDSRRRFPSEEAFAQSLNDSGLSEEELKEKLHDQLMIQRLIDDKVRSTIVVSPQEIAQEVGAHPELHKGGDRVRASHLLVRVGDRRTGEQARSLIEDLHRQLAAGAEFAALAKRYSEDAHAREGGLMDWVAQGELLPELDAALFSLKVGELSQPIQTRLGFHLVRVEERRAAENLSVIEANRALKERLYQQKFQTAFSRWIADLKRKAYIDILPSELP